MPAWFDSAGADPGPELKPGRARLSFLASFSEKYTLLVLNMAGAMVLARLLTPADVGLYAIGAVLAGLVQVVRDFGVGAYLIQERQLDRDKLRAALGVSLLVGWLLAAMVFAAGPLVAGFYREPRLQTVVQLLAINFLLMPFSALALPCLRRQLRFGAIFAINLSQTVAQLAGGIGLAWLGFGYLSLVWGALAGMAASLLASLCWRPTQLPWLPGWRGIGAIWRFGAVATGGTVIDEAGVAAPDLVIGKLIGLAEVGIFGKAMGVINVFNQLVTAAVSPVIFPLYAARARQGADLGAAFLTTASYVTALAWPFFGCVALLAPAIVRALYGNQWDVAAPLIRVLCIGAALYSVFGLARYLLVAMGEVGAQARLDATAVPLRIAAVLLAAPFGLTAVAWAVVVGALFRSWLTYRVLHRLNRVHWQPLLVAVRKSAAIALICLAGPALSVLTIGAPWKQLPAAAVSAAFLWLLAVLLVRHALADELRTMANTAARFALRKARGWKKN